MTFIRPPKLQKAEIPQSFGLNSTSLINLLKVNMGKRKRQHVRLKCRTDALYIQLAESKGFMLTSPIQMTFTSRPIMLPWNQKSCRQLDVTKAACHQ